MGRSRPLFSTNARYHSDNQAPIGGDIAPVRQGGIVGHDELSVLRSPYVEFHARAAEGPRPLERLAAIQLVADRTRSMPEDPAAPVRECTREVSTPSRSAPCTGLPAISESSSETGVVG